MAWDVGLAMEGSNTGKLPFDSVRRPLAGSVTSHHTVTVPAAVAVRVMLLVPRPEVTSAPIADQSTESPSRWVSLVTETGTLIKAGLAMGSWLMERSVVGGSTIRMGTAALALALPAVTVTPTWKVSGSAVNGPLRTKDAVP